MLIQFIIKAKDFNFFLYSFLKHFLNFYIYLIDSVDGVIRELRRNYKKLELIYRNQHYQQMREETHTDSKFTY
jgi:hypothetical protein